VAASCILMQRINLSVPRLGLPAAKSHLRLAVIGAAGDRPQKSVRTGMSSIKVLLVDDQAQFRRMVRSLIDSQADYRVCGEAGDGIDAVEKVRQLHPDLDSWISTCLG
jgi:PleD family two-component response regulator